VVRSGALELGNFFRQRQERVAFGAAYAASRVLAQKKEDEGENEAEADGESEGNDGHGSWAVRGDGSGLIFCGLARTGRADLRHSAARFRITAAPVTQRFLGGQPVFEVATFGPAVLDPDQVGGVLNLGLGWFLAEISGDVFHGRSGFGKI
jgi:hypothetical protein